MKSNYELRIELNSLFGKKSDMRAIFAVVKNWVAYIVCIIAINYVATSSLSLLSCSFYVLLSFFVGCCLRGFDNLTHEASHNNIFSAERLNVILQFLYSYPVFKTVEDYRPSHFLHHRIFQKDFSKRKELDPDTQQSIRWGVEKMEGKLTFSIVMKYYVFRFFSLYYVFDNLRYGLIPHILSKKSIIGRLTFWILVLSTVLFTDSWTLLLLAYVIPFLIWLPFIRFITESSKHNNVNLEDDFSNSRNNIGIMHQYFLHPHNDGFHQMHHFMASIPFYNLKRAYMHIKEDPEIRARLIESHSPLETINQTFK